ncbi:MAG: ribonuclease III [Pseudomonadota bacterium]
MNQNDSLYILQERLGYFFKNENLLMEALCHPSLKQHNNKSSKDYERLEFLGDTILSFILTEDIFRRFQSHDEGSLAPVRSYLVCKDTICIAAKPLSLGSCLLMTKGEELSGGRDNPNNAENAMEAIIAAIYLDGGIEEARKVILYLWRNILSQELMTMTTDYKSALQEWSQGKSMEIPKYEVISKTGGAHSPLFQVKVSIGNLQPEYGEGRSIKTAEKMAAERMLRREKR